MQRQTNTRRRTQRVAATLAAAFVGGVALSSMGCNGILGIDERTLAEDTSDALSCDTFCDAELAACTAEFQEYQTREACIATCAQIPLGAAADTTGNTIGCRMDKVKLAQDTGELGDYCPFTGPAGGGDCGDRCENFCTLFVPACGAQTEATIHDQASCLAFCQSSPDNPTWDPQDPEQKDFDASIECRIWHLANAFLDPTLHCTHADGTKKCNGSTSGTTAATTTTGGEGGGGADGAGGAGGG